MHRKMLLGDPLIPGEYSWFGLCGVVYEFGPFNVSRAWDYPQYNPLDLEGIMGYEPARDLIDSYDDWPERWIVSIPCPVSTGVRVRGVWGFIRPFEPDTVLIRWYLTFQIQSRLQRVGFMPAHYVAWDYEDGWWKPHQLPLFDDPENRDQG